MQDLIYNELKKVTSFPDVLNSYSPMFSSIGLCMRPEEKGIGRIYFGYNAFTRALFDRFLYMPYALNPELSCIYKLVFGNNKASLSFWKSDGLIFECCEAESIELFKGISADTTDLWVEFCDGEYLIIRGYSKNGDSRDPDEKVNFLVGVRAICGTINTENGFKVNAVNGKITIAVNFEALKASTKYLKSVLANAPTDVKTASQLCRRWIINNIGSSDIETDDGAQAQAAAAAAVELLFNATRAQGSLESFITPFPSRGTKPYVSMTDVYFENFGYSAIGCSLTKDFVKQAAQNRQSTGKIPWFATSTWQCPGTAAYAILGRAALNEIDYDFSFGWDVFPTLEVNNNWWMTSAITKYGLVFDDLETGITAAANALLLSQLRCTAELAAKLGLEEKEEKWNEDADTLEKNIIKYLYDKDGNIFCNADENMKTAVPSVSSSIIALWAGVNIESGKAVEIINNYVLSLADDKNIAPEYIFFKLGLLKKFGFEKEYEKTAASFIEMFAAEYKDNPELLHNSSACSLFLSLLNEK